MAMLWTPPRGNVPLSICSVGTYNCLGSEYVSAPSTYASNNWIAVNVAVFIPFWITEAVVATKMYWQNGAAVAGNIDVGIYDEAGNALVTKGNTLQAGISNIQTVDITDTVLSRGNYYMAMSSDTSGVTQKVVASTQGALAEIAFGFLEQATANPLPTPTATFAKYTRNFWPIFGIYFRTAVGP